MKKKLIPTWPLYFFLLKHIREVVFLCGDQRKLFLSLRETGDTSRMKTRICTDFVSVEEIRRKADEPPAVMQDSEKKPFSLDEPYILMVSRIDESQKDFRTLLRAYRHLPASVRNRYRLVLAGDGQDRERMMRYAKRLGIGGRAVFPGNLENPYPWMKHCSLYIHSSRVEGFSMVLVEALACGCRIAASDCETGPSEILGRGEYGDLFTPGNARELRDCMVRALERGSTPDDSKKSISRAEELARIGKAQIKEFLDEYMGE